MQQQFSNKRNVDGILLLDKPQGITSNAALQTVKRLFKARKAGHTGSLDPLASGMLPICFGEATKFSQFLLEADKYYRVMAKLGVTTTTGDTEGEIVKKSNFNFFTEARIEAILADFRGNIEQIPSMFSALKYQGQPLYKLARQGVTIERPARVVSIYELKLIEYNGDTLTLEVRCSKGTYIRTLVEDIGHALGCGAHVYYLRRLAAGAYEEPQMFTLDMLTELANQGGLGKLDALLLPLGSSVENWPGVRLSSAAAFYLRKGQPVLVPHAPIEGWVRLFLNEDQFIGVGEVLSDGKVAPRRLLRTASSRGTSAYGN